MDASLQPHRERFDADPDAVASFDALEEHLFMQEEWGELVALYEQRLAAPGLAEHPATRAQLSLRLAQVLEERMGDVEAALAAYSEAARLDPGLRGALQHLRRLYTVRASWETVLQVAELEVSAARDGDERARLYAEMGDIWRRELDDEEQAEEYYARARAEAGGTGDAEPAEEVAQLVQQAWLSAARGESVSALTSLREALEHDPGNLEAIDMMVTVLDGVERHAEMTDLLERRAALASDPDTRAAVLSRLGAVREFQLGDLAGARAAYERAVAAAPGNHAAGEALARIYRNTEAWMRLRSLLESSATRGAPARRATALCDLGNLLESQFADPEGALEAYRSASELDDACRRAQKAIERLESAPSADPAAPGEDAVPSAENRSVRIVGVLQRKLAAHEERGTGLEGPASALRLRIAELHAGPLDDPTAAIAVLEAALEDDIAFQEVADRLAALYERMGRYEELSGLAQRAALLAGDSAERAEWFRRAAETARGSGNSELAVECYTRLLEERPQDRNAEAALVELHRARGNAEPLAGLLRARIPRTDGGAERELRLELAGLLEGPLDDPQGVFAQLRRALEIDPTPPELLERALRNAAAVGEFAALDLLDHLDAIVSDPKPRARIQARRGDWLADTLGWHEEAAECWQSALALDPEQSAARARLEGAAPA